MTDAKGRPGAFPPHIHDWRTTAKAAWICSATLLPVMAWSLAAYGRRAALVWLVSLLGAVLSEAVVSLVFGRWTLPDGSAVLTGLLLASAMPPGVPLHVPAVASVFAIVVVKSVFGGLGANWMNPALGGLCFAYANWPSSMREFLLPRGLSAVEGVSAATPMSLARGLTAGGGGMLERLHAAGFPMSPADSAITGFLNDVLFQPLNARLPVGYIDLLLGLKPGTLGESALPAILLGSIILVALRLIKLEIPLAMTVSFAALTRVFGNGVPGEAFFSGDMLYALTTGGFLVVAFYMATDPVTSPVDGRLALAYGAAIGTLSYLFRRWGAHTEGIAYAVLIMNALTPTLERLPLPARRPARGTP